MVHKIEIKKEGVWNPLKMVGVVKDSVGEQKKVTSDLWAEDESESISV